VKETIRSKGTGNLRHGESTEVITPRTLSFILRAVLCAAFAATGCATKREDRSVDTGAAYSDVMNHSRERVRRVESIDDRAVAVAKPATSGQVRAEERQARTADFDPAYRGTASWVGRPASSVKAPRKVQTPVNPFFQPAKIKKSAGPNVKPGGNHPGPAPIRTRGEEAAEQNAKR
jgi:hypothetical protein